MGGTAAMLDGPRQLRAEDGLPVALGTIPTITDRAKRTPDIITNFKLALFK